MPVVDPVVELIGWIAIRRDLLRSLRLDIVQMDPHPERKKGYTNTIIKYTGIEKRVFSF